MQCWLRLGLQEKEQRTALHKAVRSYSSLLDSKFEKGLDSAPDNIVIRPTAKPRPQKQGARGGGSDNPWPRGKEYCRFVMYKEGKGTMDALSLLARFLKLKRGTRSLATAGTKDKRAITSQWVTAHRVSAQRLLGLNNRLFGIRTGNFKYVEAGLELGALRGNQFEIVLRDVTATIPQLQQALTSVREKGFLNYFGMQRFGTTAISTATVGLALLRAEWAKAVDLILCSRNGEASFVAKARAEWDATQDAAAALKLFPKMCTVERTVLGVLAKAPTNYFGALAALPYTMRTMYVHAYQSFVWNTMVSQRMRAGMAPIVGDLVIAAPGDTTATIKEGDRKATSVKVLTEADISNYTIYDVVLPLPGHAIIYPENDIGTAYAARLAADGLQLPDVFRPPQREYSLSGDYRTILVRPADVSWSIARYSDYKTPLVQSDLERLNAKIASASQKNSNLYSPTGALYSPVAMSTADLSQSKKYPEAIADGDGH